MASNCRISCNILRTDLQGISLLRSFYGELIGMAYQKEVFKTNTRHTFFFDHQNPQTAISFEECEVFNKNISNAGYWKIGITLEDIDEAVKCINSKTQDKIGLGKQFEKIGFLSHVQDSLGYTIELLQHTFLANFLKSSEVGRGILNQSISKPPNMSQITIRCKDAKISCSFYSNILGMKLLSIQPSENYPFTLYFFAYTDSFPPNNTDLEAVENREWLWKQPFAQIELQHRHNLENDFQYVTNDNMGQGCIPHVGFQIEVNQEIFKRIGDENFSEVIDGVLVVNDPDGYKIEVIKS